MRRIIASAFVSLDGVIQGPGGPLEDPTGGFDEGGWVFKLWDEGVEEVIGALFAGDYDLLLGRRTYDIFAAYWPYVEGEEAGMGQAFTRANKYVLTRGDRPLDWENSHRLASIDDVAALKQGDGPDLVIQGSSTLYPGLLAAGLIDRLTLVIFPVTLGGGKRLFGEGTEAQMLPMIEHKVTAKGTVIVSYGPGGALPPYPPYAPEPSKSDREKERQRQMADGSW
ncbi:dihydrofolate reductase family protein [Parasphingopyxis marina]|uniref:Dihydrofolate reductase n=1 Tax=Parasphingopyxis marina TaxID=2761622 RepID=A0A842I1L1_9SPHN|nr:dihydrofolate reductase family protein [Parasphingopyxis marina]MBC2778593.1 dihydrofolate reductase [Parasphingopyxis marina]